MSGVLKVLPCELGQKTITVGERTDLHCIFSGSAPNLAPGSSPGSDLASASPAQSSSGEAPQFLNSNPKTQFEIQFLGAPEISGEKISQKLTSYRVGDHEFSSIVFKMGDHVFAVSSQTLRVASVIKSESGQQPTPFPLFEPARVPIPWWWWAIWGAIILIAAVFVIVKWLGWSKEKQKKKDALAQTTPLSPAERFRSRLRKLESQGHHQKGEYKTFALELTNILKSAISDQFKFPASDQTSEEVLLTLERSARPFFQKSGSELAKIFSELDQIKFAKIETSASQCLSLLDRSLQIGRTIFEGNL